jgi:hypothetical protein
MLRYGIQAMRTPVRRSVSTTSASRALLVLAVLGAAPGSQGPVLTPNISGTSVGLKVAGRF